MVDIGDGEYVVRQSHNYRLCCQYHRGRTRTARCDDQLPRILPHRLSSQSVNFALRLGVADIGTLSHIFPSSQKRGMRSTDTSPPNSNWLARDQTSSSKVRIFGASPA